MPQLDDRWMLQDAFVSDKHETTDYNIRSLESGNRELLNLFQDIYREEQAHVHMFMEAMMQRGWLTPFGAHPGDLNRVRSEGHQTVRGVGVQNVPPQVGMFGPQPMQYEARRY